MMKDAVQLTDKVKPIKKVNEENVNVGTAIGFGVPRSTDNDYEK